MNKNEVKWTTDWNYKEHITNNSLGFSQNDWNQTLITKVHQISAKIHQHTRIGGANRVVLCSKLKPLIETLHFYNNGFLSSRYKVIVDDSLDFDTILVYNDEPSQDTFMRITGDEILVLRRTDSEEEYQEFLKSHYGCIIIQNYFTLGR